MSEHVTVDPLEPFIRAIELGCIDFAIYDGKHGELKPDLVGKPMLVCEKEHEGEHVKGVCLPSDSPRLNRWAAAVCAEWWTLNGFAAYEASKLNRASHAEAQRVVLEMIDLCRAFGRKHGGQ